jgi:molybdopterin synthase catalytic subunit
LPEDNVRAGLVHKDIDSAALISEVASVQDGAVVLFVGTVRNRNEGKAVDGIEYSAYEAMANRVLDDIAAEAARQYGTNRIAVEHRVGELGLGESSVAIAVAHAHRASAFDAARYIIEEIKKRAPIWKLEHYVDGTREWVHHGGTLIGSSVGGE